MELKLRLEPGAYITAATALLFLPVKWLCAGILAAFIHEAAHIAAIRLLRGQVYGIRISASGAKIEACIDGGGREALCALAGPAGSLSLLILAESYPEVTICGLVQGIFNLIPVYPMDGGRILRCFLPETICAGIEGASMVLLWGVGIWLGIGKHLGLLPLIPAYAVSAQLIHRKIPCKDLGFAVQ